MAKKVTAIAIEFGVKLQEFKQDLAKAGKFSDEEQKKIVSRWIAEEKKKTREAKRQAKQREKAEEAYQQMVIGGFAKIGTAIAAAGAAAAAAFTMMAQRTHEARTQILDLNKSTLILPETLAAIKMAAGGEILTDLRTDLIDFNKKISEAKRGQGELAESFAKVERAAKMQGRAFTTTDEVFRAFVAHLQDMPPSAARAELALKTFGGEGTRFMAALGGTQLKDFVELTDRFGADVSPEALKVTQEWNTATEILMGLLESTTDVLAEEGLALLGFRGDIRGIVEQIVIMDAQFRTFARNMVQYANIAQGSIKLISLAMPGSASMPEIGEDGRPIIRDDFALSIKKIENGFSSLLDSTDEVSTALAELDARYAQIDGRTAAATETAADQRAMVESLGLVYTESADTAVTGEERKRTAIERTKTKRAEAARAAKEAADEEKRRLEEIPEMYREAYSMALTAATGALRNLSVSPAHEDLGAQIFANFREGMAGLGTDDPFNVGGDDDKPDDLAGPIEKAENAIFAVGMFANETGQMINGVQDLLMKKFEGNAAKQRKVMRDMFAAQKAVAISDIVIAGAVGIANAFKIDPIFGGIMAAVIGANTAVQIATVAAESPSFHTGGMIPARGLQPDETPIRALSGEGVVSRRGMAALDALNRGDGMGAPPLVVYGARVFNDVDADLVRLPGSSVSRAIRSKTRRRIGHRA